ncbi:MAG: TonB-dependent receptor plug domain-containing protein [Bacteroidota bacterium]
MKYIPFFLFSFLFILASCSETQSLASAKASNPNQIENPDPDITLTEHLRNVPGVQVSGSGAGATIRVRGNVSINGSNDPLFVLDGQVVEGGYANLFGMIDVGTIKRINVLKDASSLASYGVRGSAGIIEIETL